MRGQARCEEKSDADGRARGTGDALIAGDAFARTIDCNGGDCEDTNDADTLHGEGSDFVRDILICGPGRDEVFFVRGQDVPKGCEIKRPSI